MSITITSPVEWQLIQNADGVADISISFSTSGFTGAVEASFNGGAWATIATVTGDGSQSGTLPNQAAGRGTLEVREVATPANNDTVANFGIGNLYLVCGDSIAEGRLTNAQNHDLVANQPSVYKQDDTWAEANDPTDTGTLNGSNWPLLARLLTTDDDIPCGFVTTSTGSRDIAGGSDYYMKPNAGWDILTSQASEAGGQFTALLLHLGPNAATVAISQDDYRDALLSFAQDVRDDIQANIPIYIGVFGISNSTAANNPNVRRGIAAAIRTGQVTAGPNLLGPEWSDGVHPKTDADGGLVAGRWYAALRGKRSPRAVSATRVGSKIHVTFDSDLTGTPLTANFALNGLSPLSATLINTRTIELDYSSYILGNDAVETVSSIPNNNGLFLWKLGVAASDGSLRQLAIWNEAPSTTDLKLALYKGTDPTAAGSLVIESAQINQDSGWKTVSVEASIVAGETYWLGTRNRQQTQFRHANTSGFPFAGLTDSYTNPFPDQFPATPASNRRLSAYATIDAVLVSPGDTLTILGDSNPIGTFVGGDVVSLPVAVNGVTTAANPIDPWQLSVGGGGAGVITLVPGLP